MDQLKKDQLAQFLEKGLDSYFESFPNEKAFRVCLSPQDFNHFFEGEEGVRMSITPASNRDMDIEFFPDKSLKPGKYTASVIKSEGDSELN
jgi:uncharacterized membrane protein